MNVIIPEKKKTEKKSRGLEPIPQKIAKYVKERDYSQDREYTLCRECGAQATEIHHIYTRNSNIPAYIDIPKIVKNNHPLNLICVCHSCHIKLDSGGFNTEEHKKKHIENNKKLEKMFPITDEVKKELRKHISKLDKNYFWGDKVE